MQYRYLVHLVLLGAAVLYLPGALAQKDSDTSGKWLIGGALDAGIDETIDSGGDTYRIGSTQAVSVGYESTNASLWATRFTVSYEFNEDNVGTTTNSFEVFPVELLFLYRLGLTRVGAGAGYHAKPTYEAELNGQTSRLELDDTFSFIAAVEFEPTEIFSIGAKYTFVNYDLENAGFNFGGNSQAEDIDGSSLGVFAVAKF